MNINKFQEIYWNYYLQLENEFFSLETFCAIDKENNNSYSTKYLQLMLSICGEIDTICKRLCKCIDETLDIDTTGINDYRKILTEAYPKLYNEKVAIKHHTYNQVQPFKAWKTQHNPGWWSVYNKIKHHRDEVWNNKEAYKHANQKNVVSSLCALYIILEYWAVYTYVLNTEEDKEYSKEMLVLKSKHLDLEDWHNFYSYFMGNNFFQINVCKDYFKNINE